MNRYHKILDHLLLFHAMVRGHVLKDFHFFFTHGVVCAIIIEDHGSLIGAFEGFVSSATLCEALDRTCLDGVIR